MSDESFLRLSDLIADNADKVDSGSPASDEQIQEAERFLGLSFPKAYKKFLRTWGTLAIGPNEYYGIAGQSYENSAIPNGIWFTYIKRKELDFPQHLVIVASSEGVQYLCLDTSNNDSAPVMIWDVSTRSVIGKRSDDFFEWILEDSQDFL